MKGLAAFWVVKLLAAWVVCGGMHRVLTAFGTEFCCCLLRSNHFRIGSTSDLNGLRLLALGKVKVWKPFERAIVIITWSMSSPAVPASIWLCFNSGSPFVFSNGSSSVNVDDAR